MGSSLGSLQFPGQQVRGQLQMRHAYELTSMPGGQASSPGRAGQTLQEISSRSPI